MSNVDMVRASFPAYDNEDFDAMREMMHPRTVQYFTDRAAALAAAGLTEEQLRQEAT